MPSPDDAIAYAEGVERLGIVGVLALIIFITGLISWHLYREKREADQHRLENVQQIGELKGQVNAVEARLEVEQNTREQHKHEVESLHRSMLEIVARGRSD